MQEVIASLTSKQVTDAIDQLGAPFKDLPHLPKGIVNFFATIAPWLAGLGGVLGVFSGLGMLSSGLGMNTQWWAAMVGISPLYFLIAGVIQLLSAAILLLAFKPLKAREKAGWILMFWNMALGVLMNLVGFGMTAYGGSSIVGMVIGLAIGLYIMFEIRSAYH